MQQKKESQKYKVSEKKKESLRRQHTIRYYFYKSQKEAKLSNILLKDIFISGDTF